MQKMSTFDCDVPVPRRWQAEEEQHSLEQQSLKLAQEGLEGCLRHEEESRRAVEQEVARQKGYIGSLRADAANLEETLRQFKAQVRDIMTKRFK